MDLTSLPRAGHPYLHFKGNVYTVLGFCNIDFGGVSDVTHVIYCDFIKNLTATSKLAFHTETLSAYQITKLANGHSDFYKAKSEIGKYEEETNLTRECRDTFQHTWIIPLESFTDILEDGTPRFKPCLYSKEYWKQYHIKYHSAPYPCQDHAYEEFRVYDEDSIYYSENKELQEKIDSFRELFSKEGSGVYRCKNGSIYKRKTRYLKHTQKPSQTEVNRSYAFEYFDHHNDTNKVFVNKISTVDILNVFSRLKVWDTEKIDKLISQIKFIQNLFNYRITVEDSRKFEIDKRQFIIDNLPRDTLSSLLKKYKIIL